ncbi:PASTA domain-containing protein [Streptomyces sp. NPDC002561]|uniref:PASTA domain-containing protein n=1 Tax=unclassified Streptomyces TaxID=2593676 RepID=UPI00332ECF9D
MNPYNNTPQPAGPWWRSTPALLGLLALVAITGALSFGLGFLIMVAAMVAVWVLPRWKRSAKVGATVAAFVLLSIGAGVTGQLDDTQQTDSKTAAKAQSSPSAKASKAPESAKPSKAADYTGQALDEAERQARAAGLTPASHDAATEARTIIAWSNWTVCFQKTEADSIDFAAVKKDEPCPEADGGRLPWPTMPNVVGNTYDKAIDKLEQADIDTADIEIDDVYLDIDTPTAEEAAEEGDEWRVCFQDPDKGEDVTSTTTVSLDLGKWTDADTVQHCPSSKGSTYKIPANDPANDNDDDSTGSTGSTGGGSSSSSGGTTGGDSVGVVHPGSFCSPVGATGVTKAGTPMLCGPGSDGRNRWHS